MDVCATFHPRILQRRLDVSRKSAFKKGRWLRDVVRHWCPIPIGWLINRVFFQKDIIVVRCFKIFQDISRNRKIRGGVLMSMPETSGAILRCYSLLWPRPGGWKAEGLQADLLYAWCAALKYANDRNEGRVWVCNISSSTTQFMSTCFNMFDLYFCTSILFDWSLSQWLIPVTCLAEVKGSLILLVAMCNTQWFDLQHHKELHDCFILVKTMILGYLRSFQLCS